MKSTSKQPSKAPATKPAPEGKFVDRNLVPVNPLAQQFEPTDQSPVPQRYKMAGGA
jgi:hypothetical protein